MRTSVLCVLLFAIFGLSWASNVVILDNENFDSVVDGSKNVLVEFYAPWCGHCKNLAPIYEQLADAFVGNKDNVVIANVDADKHRELGGRFGVTGFPTIKFFPKGTTTPKDYNSGRDLDSFIDYIAAETGAKVKKNTPKEYVVTLTDSNFDSIVMDETKDVIVEFYAPWCGHCKSLAPKYEKVAQAFDKEPDVIIAKLDADKYKSVGSRYGVTGFPTIKFFPKNNKEGIAYEGGREESSFVEYLNKHSKTFRTVTGALNDLAGKIAEFDALATKFFTNPESRAETLKEAKEKAQDKWSQFYVKVMEKLEKSQDYVKDELSRLERLIESKSISGDKLDEFSIRKNILKSFQ